MQLLKLVLKAFSITFILLLVPACSTRYPKTDYETSKRKNDYLIMLQKAAKRWDGVPYRYGGSSKSGVDCSGLVQRVYQESFGLKMPRTTRQQVMMGTYIKKRDLRAGDLLLFKTGYNTFHSAIYLENGKFLHASTKYGVRISDLKNRYWIRTYYRAKRVLP